MIAIEDTALVLLAAGRAARFGGNKLFATLDGRPLGLHAAEMLARLPFLIRVAVVAPDGPLDYAALGYAVVTNPQRREGMASSLRLGVAAARSVGASAVLVALADMPRITAAHVRRLYEVSEAAETMVASSDGRAVKPPALFGAAHVDTLLASQGDQGARDLIRTARAVIADGAELVDIDTLGELEQLRALGNESEVLRPSSS